ncbi:MAG: malonyl-CoA decarboxylase family protein [Bacteroidaceae bacterium]|nr:malonyl-CoA decarboxylase family protein [Bacteroidaceae bacterium]MBQ9642387.1 malonyl-CoA decarboxylase family protein [Bacteroidaceae bacterium]
MDVLAEAVFFSVSTATRKEDDVGFRRMLVVKRVIDTVERWVVQAMDHGGLSPVPGQKSWQDAVALQLTVELTDDTLVGLGMQVVQPGLLTLVEFHEAVVVFGQLPLDEGELPLTEGQFLDDVLYPASSLVVTFQCLGGVEGARGTMQLLVHGIVIADVLYLHGVEERIGAEWRKLLVVHPERVELPVVHRPFRTVLSEPPVIIVAGS